MTELHLVIIASVVVLLMVACVSIALLRHHRKGSPRILNLTNRMGLVETTLAPEGAVLIEGELWRACSATHEAIERGRRVRVCGARGHLLVVAPEE